MKESIGGTWLFTLVIAFVALFSSFVALSTNYSRCYKIKDEIISALETYNGINDDSLEQINSYLKSVGYTSTGKCPSDGCWYACSTTSGCKTSYSVSANYCLKKYCINCKSQSGNVIQSNKAIGHPDTTYYGVVVFFKLDLPVIGDAFSLKISGETSPLYNSNDLSSLRCS